MHEADRFDDPVLQALAAAFAEEDDRVGVLRGESRRSRSVQVNLKPTPCHLETNILSTWTNILST